MSDDSRLSRLFAEARQLDETRAPSLLRLRARRSASPRPILVALPAIATMLVLAAAGVFLWPRLAPETPSPTPGMSLESWEAPTDFLLSTPGSELLGPPPALPGPMPQLPRVERSIETKGTA